MPVFLDPPLTRREYAYLTISGLGRPGIGRHEEITSALDLKPSNSWNVGDVNPRNGKPRQSMRWELHSGLDDTHPLREHIDSLLLMLGTREQSLRALWVDYDLILQCVGYYPPMSHGAHFDRELVRQAANLGLALDLDFYFVAEPEN